jgi:hypothetical protein
MTIEKFERVYAVGRLRELQVRNPMQLGEVWENVRESGPWTVNAYARNAHNCQHFTAKVQNVLQLRMWAQEMGDPSQIPQVLDALWQVD